jgi:hypothetical protein
MSSGTTGAHGPQPRVYGVDRDATRRLEAREDDAAGCGGNGLDPQLRLGCLGPPQASTPGDNRESGAHQQQRCRLGD